MEFSVMGTLSRVQGILEPALDIIGQRVDAAEIPNWCARRGWSDFLLGLSVTDLERCEAEGVSVFATSLVGVPQSLKELAECVFEVCSLPALDSEPVTLSAPEFRGISRRKGQQLATLLGALAPLVATARRIVDVGAGSGHFSRLSARHFGRETLGVERNPERVASAVSRVLADRGEGGKTPEFAVLDAVREPLDLSASDLAIGLHACGELGDSLVRAVADSGADLALVSCCLQKIAGFERSALSRAGGDFTLRKDTLGLSNLTSQAVGVEGRLEHTLRAREARYALRLLLRARGLTVEPGSEMQGINRRQAHAGLAAIAQRALGLRGLPATGPAEVAEHERRAALHFQTVRRLSLPRNMLGRAIEMCVVLDRAARLEESGHHVRVATLFEQAVTPRNISLFASRDASRLPPVRAPAR